MIKFMGIVALLGLTLSAVSVRGETPVDPDTLPGTWIERTDGRFLRLVIEENRFQLHFHDKEKEIHDPDPKRATIRFRHPVRAPETLTMMPEPGKPYLTHPRFIRPPFTFHTIVMLVFEEGAEPAESYPLFFRQEVTPESSRALGEESAEANP